MGAVCTKPSAVEDGRESPRERLSRKGSLGPNVGRMASSKRHTSFRVKERVEGGDGRSGLLDKKYGSRKVRDDHYGNKVDSSDVVAVPNYSVIRNVPKATEGEQVAAGWPSWLAAVAGEAINGWLPRRADTFEKLDKIGQGTYSNVYKACDLTNKKFVALKRVRFDEKDPESIKFMAREILILRKLDHPNIIKLEGLVTSRRSCSLYLVFEYMEHDLTGLASVPGVKFSEPQVKCYMKQLLSGLDFCHSRGVLHRDIKGSNLLIDNHGILKIADFGLASYFDHQQNLPLTSRVVTLWYRPPELILGETHYGASVDLWSTGCILGELYAGKPIMPGRTEVEQMHRIFRLCGSPSEDYWRKSKLPHAKGFKPVQPYKRRIRETFKDLPPAVIGLMDTLLSLYPTQRGTAARALKSEYFTTEPLACDPSCLPKYPPSKELDAKMRDDEIRRKAAAGGGAPRVEQESGVRKQPWGAPNANAELALSMQRRQGSKDTKSRSEYFYPYREDVAPGFPIDPSRDAHVVGDPVDHNSRRVSHSGPLAPGFGWTNNGRKYDDLSALSSRADLSTLSGLVASRTLSEDSREKPFSSQSQSTTQRVRPSGSFHLSGPVRKSDRKHHADTTILTRDVGNGRASMKEPTSHDHGFKGNKIHFSGPILVPSNNVDQMLKEQDRRIQEAARRARIERARARVSKVQAQEMQKTAVR